MKERPILFSAPMVRAILAGTKTQTRRAITIPQRGAFVLRDDGGGWWPYQSDDGESVICNDGNERPMNCPYDAHRLWVRETFAPRYFDDGKPGYRADWDGRAADVCPEPKWKPSIFMRRHESRITLEVTDVRVERLRDISEADAIAEGVAPRLRLVADAGGDREVRDTAVDVYRDLWDSINGKRVGCAWSDNPWVWVVSFKRVEHEERGE